MNVLILGATGGTGAELVRQALALGDTVTVLARQPERLTQRHERLHIVAGDVLAPSTLADVVIGQDAVLSALGTGSSRKPTTIYSAGTRNVIDAMRQTTIERLICISSGGVSHDPTLPWWYRRLVVPLLQNIYDDMARMERVVRASALAYTIIRPGYLTNGRHTGVYRIREDLTPSKGWRISRADLADCMLHALHTSSFVRTTISVTY